MSTRTARIGWVLAFVAVGVGIAGLLFWRPGSSSQPSAEAAVPTDGGAPVPAKPAPKHPPTPVVAPGKCGEAMAAIRRLQRTYPSGAILPQPANVELTARLATLDKACASMRAAQQEFRDRELTPWLTYLPPGA